MKKGLLYILINFSSVVIADWITVEHDFNMCDQAVPSDAAAFHISDDGIAYSTSLLVREFKTISHNSSLTTVNITMWGCTYDCHFSFMMNVNRDEHTVSSYTENNQDNYKCNLSDKTMKLIPIPKITYRKGAPNPAYAFPTDLTAQYCSEGKHPDTPNFSINKTENVAECIDYLTGNDVGTYAASLQFGSGSSFLPDNYPVATYHMINSANKVFNYWERHHRGYHDALKDLSEKMTPDNLKELIPPPPPPPKHKNNILKPILIGIAIVVVVAALYFGITYSLLIPDAMASATVAAEFGAAEDAIATTAEGSVARATAQGWANEAIESSANLGRFRNVIVDGAGASCSRNIELCENVAMRDTASYYQTSTNPNIQQYLTSLGRSSNSPMQKRNKADNLGFFTINKINNIFLPTLMDNVHQSFTGSGQIYTDISSYLSAASEHLQFHFEDTLHNNFFAANKSILASFTINQGVKNYDLLDGDDDVYYHIRNNTYNHMAASIISKTLRKFNVDICDTKPSFCGQSCDSGHIYCPTIGDDKCIIAASDGQIKELQFLRDTFDICSTNTTATGWNITHNSNCNSNQFQCQ